MLVFLAFQSFVFAAWAVVSVGLLLGLAGRAISGGISNADRSLSVIWRGHLTHPETALRRRVWIGLTMLLALCAGVSVWIFATL